MLLATVAMAIITAFGVYYVWRTLVATQKVAADTREIGEAQARAYIQVYDVFVDNENLKSGKLTGRIKYRNAGQTPARKIRHELHIGCATTISGSQIIVPDVNLPPVLERGGASDGDLAAGGVQEGNVQGDRSMPDGALEGIRAGQAVVFLRGWVRYEDVFNRVHHTHFCWHKDKSCWGRGVEMIRSPFGNSAN